MSASRRGPIVFAVLLAIAGVAGLVTGRQLREPPAPSPSPVARPPPETVPQPVIHVDFEDGTFGSANGVAPVATGASIVQGLDGRRAVTFKGPGASLAYSSEGLDPSEGTFAARVRTSWTCRRYEQGPQEPRRNDTLFAWINEPFTSELFFFFHAHYSLCMQAGVGPNDRDGVDMHLDVHLKSDTGRPWRAEEWRFVTATWSETLSAMALYVDGVRTGNQIAVRGGQPARPRPFRAPFRRSARKRIGAMLAIGSRSEDDPGWFEGEIDAFWVFDRALTPAQVRALFERTRGT